MTYFHVTSEKNLSSIMANGLVSQIGERSKELQEEAGVFLFQSKNDMEDALSNWLGDWYEENDEQTQLVILEITLPDTFPITTSTASFEAIAQSVILPKYINTLDEGERGKK